MRSPEVTKERILTQSGRLFNTQGYKSTSLSDITAATGLTKGAIYRHFGSKEKLESETLMHLSALMFDQLKVRIRAKATAPEKLRAIIRYFESYLTHPPVKGGCPLLNVAIEADDANPALRKRAVVILDLLRDSVKSILTKGVQYGQLKPSVDLEHNASVIIASLEGAIMMSKLRGNSHDILHVVRHLERVIADLEV